MKFIKRLIWFAVFCIFLGVGTIFGFYIYVKPELPDVATLRNVELQTPMQVYSKDGKLMAQFGEKRRIPVTLEEIPQPLIDALLATEDTRFYTHYGIDPIGIGRAALVVAASGSAKQGASTITQQLARNFFLSNEKKIMRKIKEIFIAIHIEQLLTKDEILELYFNKIYLGHRSYGIGAAAQVYYGKTLDQLTLSEMATLAGLPKAPSTVNPLYSVSRATARRNVVLRRMLDEGFINQFEFEQAREEEVVARYHSTDIELRASYFSEYARAWMIERYGEDAYTSGFRVFTTADSKLQQAAQDAAVNNLIAYDQRHGYRGAIATLWQEDEPAHSTEAITSELRKHPTYGDLYPAVVTEVHDQQASLIRKGGDAITIEWDGMKWARRFINDERQGPAPKSAEEILTAGDLVYISSTQSETVENDSEPELTWLLSQIPAANTAFTALSPNDGAVLAMVGGFNFVHSKFNRALQSIRQVGSGIKPFLYAAAVSDGMSLATIINDAPISRWDQSMGIAWRPKNSPATYDGPTRSRIGLAQSKNVMAVRVLQRVGLDETIDYLTRFGFKREDLPRAEALALGAGSLTPLEVAQGYAVFANGGYYVEPYFIERVEDPFGEVLFQAEPLSICQHDCPAFVDPKANDVTNETVDEESQRIFDIAGVEENLLDTPSAAFDGNGMSQSQLTPRYAPQVISEQTAFIMREMLESNIWGGGDWRHDTGWNGTGWRAQALKRRDTGGKTGTTNDSKDTWYSGYGPGVVATSWVGFDNHSRSLGRTSRNANLGDGQIVGGAAGANTAQPPWVDFMQIALADTPVTQKQIPSNIVRVRIDRESGLLTTKSDHTTTFEYFVKGTEPTEVVERGGSIFELDAEAPSEELF